MSVGLSLRGHVQTVAANCSFVSLPSSWDTETIERHKEALIHPSGPYWTSFRTLLDQCQFLDLSRAFTRTPELKTTDPDK